MTVLFAEPPPQAQTEASTTASATATAEAAPGPAPDPLLSASDERCREGTVALITAASAPVRVELFASAGVPAVEAARSHVAQRLGEYRRHARNTLEVVEVAVDSEQSAARARDVGLTPVTVSTEAGKAEAFLGLTLQYGEERGVLPLDPEGVERSFAFFFANKLRELKLVAGDTRFRIGRVTGVDELSLAAPNLLPAQGSPGPSLEQMLQNSFPFFAFEPVPLSEPIDVAGVGVLFLTQPGRTLAAAELARIDEFLMAGNKTLVVIASAVNVAAGDGNFDARLDRRGVDTLLSGYGIELASKVVHDSGAPLELVVRTPGGDQMARVAHVPVARHGGRDGALDQSFAGFFALEQLAFPYASPLVLHPGEQPAAAVRAVAHTSERASATASDQRLEIRVPESDAHQERRVLAAVVEGQIQSAHSKRTAPGRLLVIASSQFAANPFVVAEKAPELPGHEGHGHFEPPPNPQLTALGASYARTQLTSTILAFKNILDWATGADALLPCGARLVARPGGSGD